MKDNIIPELETIVEENEFYEMNPEEKPLLEDMAKFEIEEQYIVKQEHEIQETIEEQYELIPEKPKDPYPIQENLFEIPDAIYRQKS